MRPPLHCSHLAQTAGRYSKLHILDLSLDGPEAFVQFVQHHIRNYSTSSSSKKQYRSSHFTDLVSFLSPKSLSKAETVSQPAASTPAVKLEPAPSLTLETESEEKSFAKWSLTFGIAQVDSKDNFERILTFEGATQRFTMKCAEAAVHVMRLLFPLPVAIVSTDSTVTQKDLIPETILNFLNAVKPFYVWSMQQGEDKNSQDDKITFEIHVHIASKASEGKKDASKVADGEKQTGRSIKCIFRKLGGIPVDQMQVAISNILHREYGVVPIVFSKMLNSGSASDCSDFIHRISNSCLQSTNMLLITEPVQPSVPQRAELFLLEQSLDCTSLYNEVVADFFISMKEELQQRIHGEDADELCRSACERIKRSPAASLPLHFHKMEPKAQERLVRYLPEQFLRRSFVSGEEDPKPVGAFEHDFDFPVFEDGVKAQAGKDDWMKYWEYLFLNCGDNRPYAPCWDPIALQDKARKVLHAISSRFKDDKKSFELGGADCMPPHLLRHLYQRFRSPIIADMLLHLNGIREQRGYSNRETVALMRRFERAIKKVFYFLMCCKRILFCKDCIDKCGLVADQGADQAYQQQYEIYALKCSMCESVPESGVLFYPKDEKEKEEKGPADSLQNEKQKQKQKMVTLKGFCFQWFMKVGLNLKKACSTSLLRHHGDPLFTSSLEIIIGSAVDKNKSMGTINLSHSRSKLSIPFLQNEVEERSRLRKIFLEVVEICRSGMVIVQKDDDATRTQMLAKAMIGIVVMAEQVNRVVAECDSLKTGCSTYEAFPKLDSRDIPGQIVTPMTHLMVAAVEGNVHKASAYIAGADISYIFHQYHDPDRSDLDDFQYKSCALHMALERGNADVANAIIERTWQLVHESAFDEKTESNMILEGLFLGACFQHPLGAHSEVPTSLMYLARYAMIEAMDKVIEILRYLRKPEQMQQELVLKVIRPMDSNGMNALHYAVLSQSPQCVAWFVPYMHDFHICRSTSKLAFVPPMSRDVLHRFNVLDKSITGQNSFQFGYTNFTRMHPPTDFSDSDCRLVISEDWIQAYHYCANSTTLVEDEKSPEHKEMSPYELALMLWRLMDIESMHAQEIVHNIQTNVSTNFHSRKKDGTDRSKTKTDRSKKVKSGQVAPVSDHSQSISVIKPSDPNVQNSQVNGAQVASLAAYPNVQNSQVNGAQVASLAAYPNVQNSQVNDAKEASLDDSSPERLAEAYKQRSNSFFKILTSLEEAADAEVEIDAKKKKGLRQFLEYRNRRAISRLVFPVIAYLGYVIASTLMAFLMTNGLMDEPTKLTQGVINELQWGPQNGPQKDIKDIGSYNDLTVFWGVLAGFLWSASPMDRPFGEALCSQC